MRWNRGLLQWSALQQAHEGVESSSVVEVGVEQEASDENSASICKSRCLLMLASCLSSSFSLLSRSFLAFSRSVSISISRTGCQLSLASSRRHGGSEAR